MQKKINKKGQLGFKALIPIALVLGIAGVVIAFTLNVQSDVQSDFTADTLEYNATRDSMEGVSNLSEKIPTLGVVAAAVIIIGALLGLAALKFR